MGELFREMLREITGRPAVFAAEVVQFLLLVGIVLYLLRRSVGPKLKERRERISAEVEKADRVEEAWAEARKQAAVIAAEARAQAERILEAAGIAVHEQRRAGLERIEQEAAGITRRAQEAIAAEKERVVREGADRLVELITQVTRRFLEEALSESDRRALTHKLILARLKEMEGTPP